MASLDSADITKNPSDMQPSELAATARWLIMAIHSRTTASTMSDSDLQSPSLRRYQLRLQIVQAELAVRAYRGRA